MTDASTPFATLPMYDWPEVAPVWDALWAETHTHITEAGIASQPRLRRSADYPADWLEPDLLLGQTCGWPYISRLRGNVLPFARFDFGLDTARAGDYFSVFVMRKDARPSTKSEIGARIASGELTVAVNDRHSQSGLRVLGECFAAPFTIRAERLLLSGGHRASIRAVAEGRADIAAIDAQSWRLALQHEAAAGDVAVVARSDEAPGLPLITAPSFASHHPILFEAMQRAVATLGPELERTIGLRGIVPAHADGYARLLEPPYGNLRLP